MMPPDNDTALGVNERSEPVFQYPETNIDMLALMCVLKVKHNGHVVATKWLKRRYRDMSFTEQDKCDTLKLMVKYATKWSILLPVLLQPIGTVK